GYDSQSEFSKWMRTQNTPIKVSPELLEVISLFDVWQTKTNGALSAAAEVTVTLWKEAAKTQILPTKEAIAGAVNESAKPHWLINKNEQ
ncbi:FAD:protein FMN transferase, partial [Escherichia coli]|uniref:FAD:protein FMN transferase n=1 Tax=Escherichia coli TaxID=562 RepID=UPI0039DF8478